MGAHFRLWLKTCIHTLIVENPTKQHFRIDSIEDTNGAHENGGNMENSANK